MVGHATCTLAEPVAGRCPRQPWAVHLHLTEFTLGGELGELGGFLRRVAEMGRRQAISPTLGKLPRGVAYATFPAAMLVARGIVTDIIREKMLESQ